MLPGRVYSSLGVNNEKDRLDEMYSAAAWFSFSSLLLGRKP